MENKKQGKLFVITGPSGVGKGTVLNKFFENNRDIIFSISATTRKPRPNEKDGVNYFFISEEEFKKEIENGDFLEWANYSGNYYGTKKSYVLKKINEGYDVLLEIETQGAGKIMEKFPDAVTIFITPPDIEELEKRLRGRKTEDEESIKKRLDKMREEMRVAQKYKYSILNDEVENALNKLQAVYDFEKNTNDVFTKE